MLLLVVVDVCGVVMFHFHFLRRTAVSCRAVALHRTRPHRLFVLPAAFVVAPRVLSRHV